MMQKFQSWNKEVAQNYITTYGSPSEPKGAHHTRMKKASSIIGSEGEMLFDVPCGIGHLYPFVKDRFIYTGIDSSPEMLKIAREHFPEGDFRLGDIYDLHEFVTPDIIVCLSLFIHLPNPLKVLRIINKHFYHRAIIGVQIGRRAIIRQIPRGDKILLVRCETLKTVKGWLKELKIDNWIIEPIEGNTHYLTIEK
ncbi:MAG: class I SAM-dependent methyltransferase [Promethearchaeota archaeon]|jgi:2-polyprenyl-3-methyl-5-hydroxy-6-metoxy-1,4-benzoquinol methylase